MSNLQKDLIALMAHKPAAPPRKPVQGDYVATPVDHFLSLDSVWDYNMYCETVDGACVIAIYYSAAKPDAAPCPEDNLYLSNWKDENLIHYRAVVSKRPAFPFTDTEETEGLNRMKMIGGSFAKAIAVAWFAADLNNRAKLRSQFTDLLRPYVEMYRNGH